MTIEQVEKRLVALIHREPFSPFSLEMADGTLLEVLHPRLAINVNGAVFFGLDGGLVDIDFSDVRAFREAPEGALS